MLKKRLYSIIFGTDTPGGRLFDIILLWVILGSVAVVILESIPGAENKYTRVFHVLEWGFTVLFTIEYVARVLSHPKPIQYIFGFWGIIDLLAILPTYLSAIFNGVHFLAVVRILRLIRVFRILKLARYLSESQVLLRALSGAFYKISLFFFAVLLLVILLGTVMYVVEAGNNGFSSIPQSIYWAIITITTVGYGDIVPATSLGKFIASFIMITGYSIIAVPTGILTVEFSRFRDRTPIICPKCQIPAHSSEAKYCWSCGSPL